MSVLEKVLGKYGPGHQHTYAGKVYTFKALGQVDKAALAMAFYQREREAIHMVKDEYTEAQYQEELRLCRHEYTSGKYAFPEKTMDFYLAEGLPTLVCQMTGCTLEEAELLCTHQQVEIMLVAMDVIMASFPFLMAQARAADRLGRMDKAKEALAVLEQLLGNGQATPLPPSPPVTTS